MYVYTHCMLCLYGDFLKWWYPTTMGFPIKNDHFGVFWGYHQKKYVNIPSEKYIYVHIYVCICVYTYLCKMDECRYFAGLS